MKPLRILSIVFLLAPFSTFFVEGQSTTGSITGVVRDTGGGVIAGVEVTVTHVGTNANYTALTNEIGVYTVRALPIGRYSLVAELPGFRRFQASGIRVQVDERVRVDVELQVGEITDSVQVTAATVGVDTQSSTLQTVIDERRVEDLPLDGRNAAELITLVAGVATYAGSGLTSGTTYPGTVNVSVNGSRGNATNFILDGGQNNDHYSNANNPMPNPDALAEFSVQTNNFSAEYGRNMGAIVNAVTKSGTNQIHGSAFGYLRNHVLNAAHFFAPPKPGDPGEKQDDGLKRSQFGATIGGPVWLGDLYDGRDRTFFFFSYQGTRLRRTPTTQFTNTFTAAERQGDFSGLSTQLTNPFTGEPYPNNQIPAEHFNPVAKVILDDLVPVPETGRQISFTELDNQNDDQYLVKVDHNVSATNVLTGRFYRAFASQPAFLDQRNVYNTTTGRTWLNTSVVIRDAHAFGPSLMNESLFSFNRTDGPNVQVFPEKDYNELGIEGVSQDDFPQYYFAVQGVNTINTGDFNRFLRDEYQVADTVRWIKGLHQLSIGAEVGYGIGDIVNNFFANGRFTFTHAAGFTGHAMSDFLVGKFSTFAQGLGEFKETRFRRLNLFVHDSMRLTPRFSMDLGLRWEPFFPYYDRLGKLSVWAPGQQSTRFVNAPEGILYPGDPGVPSGGFDTGWTNFAPRVGFAYDLTGDGRTALRAGYGIFYDLPNTISTNSQANQGPFGTRVSYFGNEFNNLSDPWGGFPGGNPLPVTGFDAVGTDVLDPPADATFVFPHIAFSYAPDMRNAYMQSWNVTLERQVGDVMIRSAYVGSKGTALVSGRDINAPLPDPTASTGTTNERRPMFPNLGRVTLIEGVGNSSYHGLQLTAERRFAQGYSILANYTWSKAIDNNQGSANKATGVTVTNPLDQSLDRGLANFDRPHVFNFSGLWELPGRFENAIVSTILGAWNLTSIVSLHSGEVFTVASGQDNARTAQGGQRADLVGDPFALGDNRPRGDAVLEYLNKDAFAPNALGTYGTLGRNTFRGPGHASVNLGLHKNFFITEEARAQFRFEMFNAFNRVNLSGPNSSMTSGNFMRITGAGDPRILQLALRLEW
ncbi:MAG: carboxypeptidase regulatory-like domain-containing protein [Acidobacteriota bacterium]